jgi:hypothetical protein
MDWESAVPERAALSIGVPLRQQDLLVSRFDHDIGFAPLLELPGRGDYAPFSGRFKADL